MRRDIVRAKFLAIISLLGLLVAGPSLAKNMTEEVDQIAIFPGINQVNIGKNNGNIKIIYTESKPNGCNFVYKTYLIISDSEFFYYKRLPSTKENRYAMGALAKLPSATIVPFYDFSGRRTVSFESKIGFSGPEQEINFYIRKTSIDSHIFSIIERIYYDNKTKRPLLHFDKFILKIRQKVGCREERYFDFVKGIDFYKFRAESGEFNKDLAEFENE